MPLQFGILEKVASVKGEENYMKNHASESVLIQRGSSEKLRDNFLIYPSANFAYLS